MIFTDLEAWFMGHDELVAELRDEASDLRFVTKLEAGSRIDRISALLFRAADALDPERPDVDVARVRERLAELAG